MGSQQTERCSGLCCLPKLRLTSPLCGTWQWKVLSQPYHSCSLHLCLWSLCFQISEAAFLSGIQQGCSKGPMLFACTVYKMALNLMDSVVMAVFPRPWSFALHKCDLLAACPCGIILILHFTRSQMLPDQMDQLFLPEAGVNRPQRAVA